MTCWKKLSVTPHVTGWILENWSWKHYCRDVFFLEKIYFRPAMLVYGRIDLREDRTFGRFPSPSPQKNGKEQDFLLVMFGVPNFWDIPMSGTQKQSKCFKQNTNTVIVHCLLDLIFSWLHGNIRLHKQRNSWHASNAWSLTPRIYGKCHLLWPTNKSIELNQPKQYEFKYVLHRNFLGGPLPSLQKKCPTNLSPPKKFSSPTPPLDQEVVHLLQVSPLVQSLGDRFFPPPKQWKKKTQVISRLRFLPKKLVKFYEKNAWNDTKREVDWKLWESASNRFFVDEIHLPADKYED